MNNLRLSVLLLFFTAFFNLNAQWIKTNGPVGGNVRSITYSGGELYAATSGNGIFISKDNGLTWEKTYKWEDPNRPNEPLYLFALASVDSTLFLGSDGDGIFLSLDKGAHWTFSALRHNHVWDFLTVDDTLYAIAESGIYITKDKGISWNKFNPDEPLDMTNCIQLKGDTLYSGTNGGVYFTSLSGGKWTKISTGLGQDSVVDHMALKDSLIFVGTASGVYRSSDNGAVWTKCSDGITESYISALYVNGNDILAGSYEGAFISRNNGQNWEQLPFENQNVWCFYRKDDKIYAGTSPGGIYVSSDNCKTWGQLNLINSTVISVLYNGNRLIAATGGGIFNSTDSGQSWNKSAGLPSGHTGSNLTQIGNMVFASVSEGVSDTGHVHGIYVSTDDGNSWTVTGLTLGNVNCISSSGSSLYAGLPDGFYVSTDFGKSWTSSASGLPKRPYISSIFPSGGKIYISASDSLNQVFVSEDEGKTWKGLGLKGLNISSVAKIDNYLFAASDFNGIFASTNEGADWKEAASGLNSPYAKMLLNVNKSLFTILSSQIYVTNNYGTTWSDITGDIDIRYPRCLAPGATELFAGTYGDGLWKRPVSGLLSEIENKPVKAPVKFSLEQNYPNPFNPATTIIYSIPKLSYVEVKVFDMLGREVITVVSGEQSAGEYKIQFDGSSLPSGIYVYTIQAGQFRDAKKLVLLK